MTFKRRPKPEEWDNAAAAGGSLVPLDPDADPVSALHVRFNPYELDRIGKLAKREDVSKQRLVRKAVRLLIESHYGTRTGP